MPVDVPWDAGDLWTALQPRFEWPQTDEDGVGRLGAAWTNGGTSFAVTGAPEDHRGGPWDDQLSTGWPDDAGKAYQDKTRALRDTTVATGEKMKWLGWLSTEFGNDLRYAKESIAKFIRSNAWLYVHMDNFFGWPDNAGRQQLVDRMAALINAFLDQIEERIAARGAGEPESERPQFPDGELTDDRWNKLLEAAQNIPGGPKPGAGSQLRDAEDVVANPRLLEGKSPQEVEAIIGNTPGWEIGTLNKGRSAGAGWTFRERNAAGTDYTGRYIQWSPGSSRHFGGAPYWKVSDGIHGTVRFPQ